MVEGGAGDRIEIGWELGKCGNGGKENEWGVWK
jgi:hypothetical protein